jgi:flagellar basal body-associated protein FliL
MEAEDSEESHSAPKAPKKSRLGLVLAIVAVTVLVTGAAVAGTVFGPTLLGRGKAGQEDDGHAKEKGKGKDGEKGKEADTIGETIEFPPIMVDARADDGNLHHIKVVIAVEISEGTKKDEFMRYAPRGREAAVGFLRSESFDKLVAPANYADVRVELSKKFSEAVGEERVGRVLITDFVAQ